MKSDVSRETFDPKKHYTGVRMQQGRVQVDADWNEQADIAAYITETEGTDVIGSSGGPVHDAGFGLTFKGLPPLDLPAKLATLVSGSPSPASAASISSPPISSPPISSPPVSSPPSAGPLIKANPAPIITPTFPIPSGDFLIGAGRYYVDGILCENDNSVLFSRQPDLPSMPGSSLIPTQADSSNFPAYLVYLDVWERNITALDDPSIREVALGGPDTATRVRTVWQVKLFGETNTQVDCFKAFNDLKNSLAVDGQLSARTNPGNPDPNPCIIAASSAYRGLENQLYRVEIHTPGPAFDIASPPGPAAPITQIDPSTISVPGNWSIGQAVEVFLTAPNSDPKARMLFVITGIDSNTKNLSLNDDLSGIDMSKGPQLRTVSGATFKWSRDNGSVLSSIQSITTVGGKTVLQVSSLGNDSVLGFGPGQWVEISDDTLELNNQPGQLVQIDSVDPTHLTITLKSAPAALLPGGANPKVRRWDGLGAVDVSSTNPPSDGWLNLENSVQVQFAAGSYSTGDYWLIPARTATADVQSGNIQWPQQPGSQPPVPLALSPFGIIHHYCPLAVILWDNTNKVFSSKEDCRRLFQPLCDPTLYYVDGDGQEAMPGNQLPAKLQVRAGRGQVPVPNAKVMFRVVKGTGTLAQPGASGSPGQSVTVITEVVNGLAECSWTLDAANQSQQVEAVLVDSAGTQLPGPVRFNANLSLASQVAYSPPAGCATLQGATTVKDALDDLAGVTRIYYVGGDGQVPTAIPDLTTGFVPLPQPLEVAVYSNCGPAAGRSVRFTILSGGGVLASGGPAGPGPIDVKVDPATGIASCTWAIDSSKGPHLVEGRLLNSSANQLEPPVRFSANYSPGFRVNEIALRDSSGNLTALANDSIIKSNQLGSGLAVRFTQAANPATIVGKPVCVLTVEIPFPLTLADALVWGAVDAGQVPLTVHAVLGTNSDNTQLLWTPGNPAQLQAYLNRIFALMSFIGISPPLLARLKVKGNFISSADQSLLLDADAFGALSGAQTALILPSGDGRRGGDLDMWFWIEVGSLEVNSVGFININPNTAAETLIGLASFPPPNPSVSIPSSPTTIEITFNRPTSMGLSAPSGPSIILESITQVAGVIRIAPVAGTAAMVTNLAARFTPNPSAGALPAGEYRLAVLGVPRNPLVAATASDDKTPLDGAYSGVPGSDFVMHFSIDSKTVVRGGLLNVINPALLNTKNSG